MGSILKDKPIAIKGCRNSITKVCQVYKSVLQSYRQHAYLMRDEQVYNDPRWIALATWTNFQGAFKFDLTRLLKENDRFKGYAQYFSGSLDKH